MAVRGGILDVEWERPPLIEERSDAELERWARKEGMTPRGIGYFAPCPWLARACVRLNTMHLSALDRDVADLVTLVVSRDNACRFCYAGARILLRSAGVREADIDRLEGDLLLAGENPALGLALDFARRVSRSNPPPSASDLKALREAGYSDAEIKELAFVTATYVAINRLTTFVALPPEFSERVATSWLLRLAQPLLRRRLLDPRHQRRGPVFLSEDQREGPFFELVCALDGLPVAPKLRTILDECFASAVLPRRAKALVFAVVARGLGCAHSERETFRLLAGEGFSAEQTEEILAHLAAPALDDLEATILPFVRETLWYQPAPIQRRAREVQTRLSEEQFLELMGTAAIANAVCRLCLVLGQVT
jgi:AhpD family alkylhydroperoxidase